MRSRRLSEFLIPYLHPTPASLLDYLPRQALVLIDDRQSLETAISEIEEQAVAMRRDFIADGTLAERFPVALPDAGRAAQTRSAGIRRSSLGQAPH